jgi:ATP-dependent Clp protease ATP-binding subunit ClpC
LQGKPGDTHWPGFTRRARQAVQLAREAVPQSDRPIGTEHLLLGLSREESGLAARVLENLGIAPEAIRDAIAAGEDWPEPGADTPPASTTPGLTHQSQRALEGAVALAGEWQHEYVGTEHILWSLTQIADSNIVLLLELLGIAPDMVQAELLRHVRINTRSQDGR